MEAKPPPEIRDDDCISAARRRLRQMEQNVAQNKSLLARTSLLIQRLSDLLARKSKP